MAYVRPRHHLRPGSIEPLPAGSRTEVLDAEPVGLPPGVTVSLDARALAAGDTWSLSTRLGQLDLLGEPARGSTYATLLARARLIHGKETYRVASIEDLLAMKHAAGRPRDIGHLEILQIAAEEIERRSRECPS